MAEITVTVPVFRKMVKDLRIMPRFVFESADALATNMAGTFVRAVKHRPGRIYRKSIPMKDIGYSGIASWHMRELGSRRRVNGKR